MNLFDYIVLGGIVIAVIFAIMRIVRRKKQGKNICGNCPYNNNCQNKVCKK